MTDSNFTGVEAKYENWGVFLSAVETGDPLGEQVRVGYTEIILECTGMKKCGSNRIHGLHAILKKTSKETRRGLERGSVSLSAAHFAREKT